MPEPRVGFAYQLTSDQKTVLRGGFGTSHDREQGNLVFNTVFADPANVITPTVLNGNMLDISSLPQQAPGVLGNVYGADQTGKVPVLYSYNLGIQRELARGTTLDVAYVGTLGRHLVTQSDINSVPFGTTFTRAAQDPSQFPGGVVPAVEPNLPPEYAAAGYDFSGAYAYTTNYLVPTKDMGRSFTTSSTAYPITTHCRFHCSAASAEPSHSAQPTPTLTYSQRPAKIRTRNTRSSPANSHTAMPIGTADMCWRSITFTVCPASAGTLAAPSGCLM